MARTGLNFTWKMFTKMRVRCEVRGRLECFIYQYQGSKNKKGESYLKLHYVIFPPFSNDICLAFALTRF